MKTKLDDQNEEDEEKPCACKYTEGDSTIPNVPAELTVEMPATIEEYDNARTLKKYFFDTFVTNLWVTKVKNSLPFVCKCCKTVHPELYKKVIVHILKGGELPSEIVQENGNDTKNDKKVLACLFCQCTNVTCPVMKRVLDIDKIRENTRIISTALTPPTNCSPRTDAGMVDLTNKQGLVPYSRNKRFDLMENLGVRMEDYRLKYLLDDSTLSMSDARCDASTTSDEMDKHSSQTEFKACHGPEDGTDKCYRGPGVMYLIGVRELHQNEDSTKQSLRDDENNMDVEGIPARWRGILTDDPLYGKDCPLCEQCYKRVELNNYVYIFRRTVKKVKSDRGTLVCTCELDPYDVIEAEVEEGSECNKVTKNVRKFEFNILMNNVIAKWNAFVKMRKEGGTDPVDSSTMAALEDLARFFYKSGMDDGLLSRSISYSGVSSASKPSSTESDILCKVEVVANKLYKKFPPCAAMLEELQEKINEGGEGDVDDPLVKIKNYAKELKIRMMPQKISLKKQSGGKKKEVYCDTHEKEEMAGLIKHEADSLIKQNAPEDEAPPEDEESVVTKLPRCPESIVDTASDEENVDRLVDLIEALQKRSPKEEEEEVAPCACGIPSLIKTTSEDNCKQWISENWENGYLIERLKENEEILVELEREGDIEKESDLTDNYKKVVSMIAPEPEEKFGGKQDIPAKKAPEVQKGKEQAKAQTQKKKAQEKKGDKGERPSKVKKKSRRLRSTLPPDEMEAHSLNYRQMVEYLHSRKHVSFKDITRLYKYPVIRLPAPQWRLRNKILGKLRNRKIMLDDGKGHRMQIFVLPTETWKGKVLSKPFISYGMLKRKIMPFRQKFPKWVKPTNFGKYKKRNVIKEDVLKNLIFPETEEKKKKGDKKGDSKGKKKFCRSARSKYQSRENIEPLLSANYNVSYCCKEINDESNQCFGSDRYLRKEKVKMARDELNERNENNEINYDSDRYFIDKKYLEKKETKNKNRSSEISNESNQWFLDERHFAKNKKKKTAKDVWEKHKNCEKYVVSLVKIPPDVVVKRKYMYKRIMVDPHRKLIVIELKRGEKHHSQSLVRYFIPFIIVSKTRLPIKRKKSDHPDHIVYLIRNAVLKQIKTRFRLPPMRIFVKKLIELSESLFKLTMGYEVKKKSLKKLQRKRFELLGYRRLKGRPIEDIALYGFNVVMYWLIFKLKLYTLYSLLRSEKFDALMAPMVAQQKPPPENSSEWLEELNHIRFEIQCRTLMEIEEYGLETKGMKAKRSKLPSLAKALDKCRQCANPLSKAAAGQRALDIFNSLVELVKQLYDYNPPTIKSINAFKLPELEGSDDEIFGLHEEEVLEVVKQPQKQAQQPQQQQKQAPQQKQIAQKQPDKKGGAAAEVSGRIEPIKFRKWMNYEFEYYIYKNQRSLTIEGLIEYIKEGQEEPILKKTSLELVHVIPGLLGITTEGLMEAEKEQKGKGKKKGGGRHMFGARSRKSCSCIRRGEDLGWPTFQELLVREVYGLPVPLKLSKDSKSIRLTRKTKGKAAAYFGKPKLMILPSKKPNLIIVKESSSEPIVIAKGELNIPVNIDKMEIRNRCAPLLTKLNTTTINNLLTKIPSQNLVKNKLMQFISVAKHKKKLKPSYSDPMLYKKSNPIISEDYHERIKDLPKLKKTCSTNELVSFEQNVAASKLINIIADYLEDSLTAEVLSRKKRRSCSESNLTKYVLPIIRKISVEKIIKRRSKRRNVRKVISKKMKSTVSGIPLKVKTKLTRRDQSSPGSRNKGTPPGTKGKTEESLKAVKKEKIKTPEGVLRKIGKSRVSRPITPEIVTRKGGKNKGLRTIIGGDLTRKTGKNQGLPTNNPRQVTRKTGKNQSVRTTPGEITSKIGKKTNLQTATPDVTRKTGKNIPSIPGAINRKVGKRKFESIKKKYIKEDRRNEARLEYISSDTDGPVGYDDMENNGFEKRKYCRSARRKTLVRKVKEMTVKKDRLANSSIRTLTNQKDDPLQKTNAQTILTHLMQCLAEIPQKGTSGINTFKRSKVVDLEVSTDDGWIRTKKSSHSISKKVSNSKSSKQRSSSEMATSVKKEEYLSSTLCSGEIQDISKKRHSSERKESSTSHHKRCEKENIDVTEISVKKEEYSSSTLCSGEVQIKPKKIRQSRDKKESSDPQHKSREKKSSNETNTSMKIKEYSSSTLCSGEVQVTPKKFRHTRDKKESSGSHHKSCEKENIDITEISVKKEFYSSSTIGSGEVQVTPKKFRHTRDKKESSDSHHKSSEKEHSNEIEKSMKKEQYSSSTSCSGEVQDSSIKSRYFSDEKESSYSNYKSCGKKSSNETNISMKKKEYSSSTLCSGEVQVTPKKIKHSREKKESSDPQHKCCEKKSSNENNTSMKKEEYSSGTLCSGEVHIAPKKIRHSRDKKESSGSQHRSCEQKNIDVTEISVKKEEYSSSTIGSGEVQVTPKKFRHSRDKKESSGSHHKSSEKEHSNEIEISMKKEQYSSSKLCSSEVQVKPKKIRHSRDKKESSDPQHKSREKENIDVTEISVKKEEYSSSTIGSGEVQVIPKKIRHTRDKKESSGSHHKSSEKEHSNEIEISMKKEQYSSSTIGSGEVQATPKKIRHTRDKKESSGSHHKSSEKKHSNEIEISMKKEQYSSSTLCSGEVQVTPKKIRQSRDKKISRDPQHKSGKKKSSTVTDTSMKKEENSSGTLITCLDTSSNSSQTSSLQKEQCQKTGEPQ